MMMFKQAITVTSSALVMDEVVLRHQRSDTLLVAACCVMILVNP